MSLLKRKPRKLITARAAAEILGYRSTVTIKRMIHAGTFRGVKMSDGPTSAWLLFEAEVLDYYEKRTRPASR